jgi:hypothetical protein
MASEIHHAYHVYFTDALSLENRDAMAFSLVGKLKNQRE